MPYHGHHRGRLLDSSLRKLVDEDGIEPSQSLAPVQIYSLPRLKPISGSRPSKSLWSISYLTAIVFQSRLIVTDTKHRPSHIDDDKSPCLVGDNFFMRLTKEICIKALTGAQWVCTTNARSVRMQSRMAQIREPLLLRVTVKSGLVYRPLAPVRALIQSWCPRE